MSENKDKKETKKEKQEEKKEIQNKEKKIENKNLEKQKKPETEDKEQETKIKEKPETEEKKETKQDIKEDKEKKSEKEKQKQEKKQETKQEKKETKPKKTYAEARAYNLPLSTKQSIAICKFIKNKPINKAAQELNLVIRKKLPVPMKGEIAHKKNIMSGRFPKKASQHFISVLKNLSANANHHEIEKPIITEAIANIGSRPYGRFGMIKRKRTHLIIKAKNPKEKLNKEK